MDKKLVSTQPPARLLRYLCSLPAGPIDCRHLASSSKRMAGIKGKSPRSNYTCRFLAFLQLLLSSNSFASLIPFFVAHAEQENGSPWRCNLPCYGYGIMHGYKPLCNGAAEFVTCGAGAAWCMAKAGSFESATASCLL